MLPVLPCNRMRAEFEHLAMDLVIHPGAVPIRVQTGYRTGRPRDRANVSAPLPHHVATPRSVEITAVQVAE